MGYRQGRDVESPASSSSTPSTFRLGERGEAGSKRSRRDSLSDDDDRDSIPRAKMSRMTNEATTTNDETIKGQADEAKRTKPTTEVNPRLRDNSSRADDEEDSE